MRSKEFRLKRRVTAGDREEKLEGVMVGREGALAAAAAAWCQENLAQTQESVSARANKICMRLFCASPKLSQPQRAYAGKDHGLVSIMVYQWTLRHILSLTRLVLVSAGSACSSGSPMRRVMFSRL